MPFKELPEGQTHSQNEKYKGASWRMGYQQGVGAERSRLLVEIKEKWPKKSEKSVWIVPNHGWNEALSKALSIIEEILIKKHD